MCGLPCPNKLDGSLAPQSGSCHRAGRFGYRSGQARFFQLLGTACIFRRHAPNSAPARSTRMAFLTSAVQWRLPRHRIFIASRSSAWLALSSELLQQSKGHHHRVRGFGIRRQLCIRNRRDCSDTIRKSAIEMSRAPSGCRTSVMSREVVKKSAVQRRAAHSSSSDTIKSGAFDQPERDRRDSTVYWLAPCPIPAFFCAFCRSCG